MMVANKVFGSGGVDVVSFIKGRGWVSTERVKSWPWISMQWRWYLRKMPTPSLHGSEGDSGASFLFFLVFLMNIFL